MTSERLTMRRHKFIPATDNGGLGSLVDAVTDSLIQDIGTELRRQGKGTVEDIRSLRAAVREVVRRRLRNKDSLPVRREGAGIPALQPEMASGNAATTGGTLSAPLVVRPRQACEMLSIGLTRLYELLHDGQLESFRYGRSRRITMASIRAYIERHIEASPTI